MRDGDALPRRTLRDFEGIWRLERRIVPVDGPSARFEGTAQWSGSETGLAYREEGQMLLEGHAPLHAERRYNWTQDLSVYFEDGRFFHQVPEEGGEAVHWCDPDRYTLNYAFQDWPDFSVFWHVQGPRKDYHAHSRYTRL